MGHHGERLHRVQHITEGMRVSLIFFIGDPAYAEQVSAPPAQKLRRMQPRQLEAYLNVMENVALFDGEGVDLPDEPARGEGGFEQREVEVFRNDVLPPLEAPRVQESAAWAARLLHLASSLLVPDFGAPEGVLGRRRAAAPRAEGALLAILRRHGADEGVVAEACGVVERLQCAAGGGCRAAAALCAGRSPPLPAARQAAREPGALGALHARCRAAFDAAYAVELVEAIDPACAQLWSLNWEGGGGAPMARQPPPDAGPDDARGEEL